MARPRVTPIMIARALMSRLTPEERAAFAAWLTGEPSVFDQRNSASAIDADGLIKEYSR